MKNLKLFLLIIISLVGLQSGIAQQELAMVDVSNIADDLRAPSLEKVVVDKTGVEEITAFLNERLLYPSEALAYTNEVKVNLQVSLNKRGEIIAAHVVEASHQVAGRHVLETLLRLEKTSPILINGVASAQTIQIPVVFKK